MWKSSTRKTVWLEGIFVIPVNEWPLITVSFDGWKCQVLVGKKKVFICTKIWGFLQPKEEKQQESGLGNCCRKKRRWQKKGVGKGGIKSGQLFEKGQGRLKKRKQWAEARR